MTTYLSNHLVRHLIRPQSDQAHTVFTGPGTVILREHLVIRQDVIVRNLGGHDVWSSPSARYMAFAELICFIRHHEVALGLGGGIRIDVASVEEGLP